MTLVLWIWGLALLVCSLAALAGILGGIYIWRVRRTKPNSSALMIVMLLGILLGLGGAINAVTRFIQFLHHP